VLEAPAVLGDIAPDLGWCGIPSGTFMMGDDAGRFDERPAHPVRVGAFWLARFPVTNRDYGRYLAAVGAEAPRFWTDPRFNTPLQPVVGVSWFEAVAYCSWLSERTGRPIHLPTEAQREWAAIGGLEGARYPWGNEEPQLIGAWARGSGGQDRPVPVSGAAPNGYGLCHMADNVHEWCSDWWDPSYYAVSPTDNPLGPSSGTRRASRGGAWRHDLKFCRCSARSSLDPSFRYNDYGFRLAADAESRLRPGPGR
jgi:formylglycine-generating enzyme required for sulfatase activity